MALLKRLIAFGLFYALINLNGAVRPSDYCKLDLLSTPCRTNCSRADSCGYTGDLYKPLTPEERKLVVDTHNFYRNGVASGKYSASYLPPCTGGINTLSYSLELEFLAGCWINQCDFKHDQGRVNHEGVRLSQNLHQTYGTLNKGWQPSFIPNGITQWFNEHLLMTANDSSLVHKFYRRRGVGHMTAMLWGDTQMVGCAKMHFMQRRRSDPTILDHAYSLYCNYYPSGNWVRRPVYRNKSCNFYSSEWPLLCGEERPMWEDHFNAPQIGLPIKRCIHRKSNTSNEVN